MTLALVAMRRDCALVATDTALNDEEARFRRDADGVLCERSKLYPIALCNAVMLVQGRPELIGPLWQSLSDCDDTDVAIEQLAKALRAARQNAGLPAADYSRHDAFRCGRVWLVGYSAKHGRMVCARFETEDQWATFEGKIGLGSADADEFEVCSSPPFPGWEARRVRTVDDVLEFARAQVHHKANVADGPLCGRNSPFGGRLICAEVTKDHIHVTSPGELGYPPYLAREPGPIVGVMRKLTEWIETAKRNAT